MIEKIPPEVLFEGLAYINPLRSLVKHALVGAAAAVATSKVTKSGGIQTAAGLIAGGVSAYVDHKKDSCRKRCNGSRNECYYRCYIDASRKLYNELNSNYNRAVSRGEVKLAKRFLDKKNFAQDLIDYYTKQLKKTKDKKKK